MNALTMTVCGPSMDGKPGGGVAEGDAFLLGGFQFRVVRLGVVGTLIDGGRGIINAMFQQGGLADRQGGGFGRSDRR